MVLFKLEPDHIILLLITLLWLPFHSLWNNSQSPRNGQQGSTKIYLPRPLTHWPCLYCLHQSLLPHSPHSFPSTFADKLQPYEMFTFWCSSLPGKQFNYHSQVLLSYGAIVFISHLWPFKLSLLPNMLFSLLCFLLLQNTYNFYNMKIFCIYTTKHIVMLIAFCYIMISFFSYENEKAIAHSFPSTYIWWIHE